MWAAVVLEEDELTTEDVLLSEVRVLDAAGAVCAEVSGGGGWGIGCAVGGAADAPYAVG